MWLIYSVAVSKEGQRGTSIMASGVNCLDDNFGFMTNQELQHVLQLRQHVLNRVLESCTIFRFDYLIPHLSIYSLPNRQQAKERQESCTESRLKGDSL
jgi:hypothetical protein